jgi:N-acetylated-alpha-linked acidic dipeptidase
MEYADFCKSRRFADDVDTMATIPGHITDEVIVLGNHRDGKSYLWLVALNSPTTSAWILGGSDPSSGTATQYELIRGLGKLLGKGWKPLRTVVLASWDAEEYGLIGSTEWAEDFGGWLAKNSELLALPCPGGDPLTLRIAAAYLNLDSAVAGSNFGAAASPVRERS